MHTDPRTRDLRWAWMLAWLLVVASLSAPVGLAQFRPGDYRAESDQDRAEIEYERSRPQQAAYELRRALAHARLGAAASTIEPQTLCPATVSQGDGHPTFGRLALQPLTPRSALRPTTARWSTVAPASQSAAGIFGEYISEQVVQSRCINCHVEGGVSGHTRLVLSASTVDGHEALNLAVFENLTATIEGATDLILNKIQGVAHGGGIQVPAGSADFANMERFLRLLSGEGTSGTGLSPDSLFEGVTMASPARTLRRAALVFAGRLPTPAELTAVSDGSIGSLRRTIRGLMTGPGFHQFLIRASNDRLLTDRHIIDVLDPEEGFLVDLANIHWEKAKSAIDRGYDHPIKDREFREWERAFQFGASRAPLELIAHVVENDLPYTEILTADYVMANPFAARAYGADTAFDDPNDPYEFRPSRVVSYFRNDDSKIRIETDDRLGRWIANPGTLSTKYPHAGILNTTAFLLRYPTTATNRNRARARWTYYYFLGLDIEKSAARTTDPDALADTDNPTMKNPACTVCHSIMDPVAGTFQNYGEEGLYRDAWGGLDSLAGLYKRPKDGSESPYQEGDTWYRDMRDPGFDGVLAPSADNSVQWLAERIATDPRFAEAAVKFWWPAILGVEVASPPEDEGDSGFEAQLVAATAQQAEVERLADAFRQGIAGGKPFNGRDLLAEIALSPWFRAESTGNGDPVRDAALAHAGMERILTPEELEIKTEAITGYVWGRRLSTYVKHGRDTHLNGTLAQYGRYELMYGGIDSDGIAVRAGDLTPLMAAVAQRHAIEISCPVVMREFFLLPERQRRLFGGIDKTTSPVWEAFKASEITAESWRGRQTVSILVSLAAGTKTVRLAFTNDFYDSSTKDDRNLALHEVIVRDQRGSVIERIELKDLAPQQEPDCNRPRDDSFKLSCEGWLDVPVSVPVAGEYRIDVSAWQDAGGDEPAKLEITVESDGDSSRGALAIKRKLSELHETLFGVTPAADSPDIEESYRLFREVWERRRATEGSRFSEKCHINDIRYFEGLVDEAWGFDRWGNARIDERAWDLLDRTDRSDPHHVARTWVVVLAYLLSDYRYLYF
ncbi:MAG: DUF1588 domain-containing protein [Acidobacteriia bacterium]|nr:DUF1588 domain-containing protein [Terriglobia bacterium]MYK09037.1 DUF1588 domain-containing protein [Terriglobia bacterium]